MKIKTSSRLMRNYIAGTPLSKITDTKMVQTRQGDPILFGLSENRSLSLLLQKATGYGEWNKFDYLRQIDLTKTKFPHLPHIECFDAVMNEKGDLWVAFVTIVNSKHVKGRQDSELYISTIPALFLDTWNWGGIGDNTLCVQVMEGMVVNKLSLSCPAEGEESVHVACSGTRREKTEHWQADPIGKNEWRVKRLTMPQNADSCIAASPGYVEGKGRGYYTICQLGPYKSVLFMPLEEKFGRHNVSSPSIEFDIPEDFDPNCLATYSNEKGVTELFVGGKGVLHFRAEHHLESYLQGELVGEAPTEYLSNLKHLLVSKRGNNRFELWGINHIDQLVHTTGKATGSDWEWTPPLPCESEVTTIASHKKGESIAFGKSDGTFGLMMLGKEDSHWHRLPVHVGQKKEAHPIDSYTLRAVVEKDGAPQGDETVYITSEDDCTVFINGNLFKLSKGETKEATTSPTGVLNVIMATHTLSAPDFTFELTNGEKAVESPAGKVQQKLELYDTKEKLARDLANTLRPDGTPLFTDKANDSSCEEAVYFLKTMTAVRQDIATQQKRNLQQEIVYDLNISGSRKRDITLEDMLNAVSTTVGEFIEAVLTVDQELKRIVIGIVDGVYHAMVEVRDFLIKIELKALSEIIGVVNFVLKKIFNFDFNDLMTWLGHVFHWDEIMYTQKALVRIMDLALKSVEDNISTCEKYIDKAVHSFKELLKIPEEDIDMSNEIFQKRINEKPSELPSMLDSPELHWLQDHLQIGFLQFGGGQSIEYKENGCEHILEEVFIDEGLIIANTAKKIQALAKKMATNEGPKTRKQFVTALLPVLENTVVDSVENVMLGLIEYLEEIVEGIRTTISTPVDIPVLTCLFEEVICQEKEKLTIANLVALLVAAPLCTTYRAAMKKAFLTEKQKEKILAATTFNEVLIVFNDVEAPILPDYEVKQFLPVQKRTLSSSSNGRGDNKMAVVVIKWITSITRTISTLAFSLTLGKEISSSAKGGVKGIKFCVDLLTISLSMSSALVKNNAKNWDLDLRKIIDFSLTCAKGLYVVKDFILLSSRPSDNAPDMAGFGQAESVADAIGAFIGVLRVFGTIVSFAIELGEDPPSELKEDGDAGRVGWYVALSSKLVQNLSLAANEILTFPANEFKKAEQPEVEIVLNGIKIAAGVLEALCSFTRAALETGYDFTDYEY